MAAVTLRTFLAIEIAERIKEEVMPFAHKLEDACPEFRFIPPENWHLTLHFLGEVEAEKLEMLKSHMPKTLLKTRPFSVFLEGFGVFPNYEKPRILWIGIGGELPPLLALQTALGQLLQELRFEVEKRTFHPHITIARAKKAVTSARTASLKSGLDGLRFQSRGDMRVSSVALFSSDLAPQGARYCRVSDFSFSAS